MRTGTKYGVEAVAPKVPVEAESEERSADRAQTVWRGAAWHEVETRAAAGQPDLPAGHSPGCSQGEGGHHARERQRIEAALANEKAVDGGRVGSGMASGLPIWGRRAVEGH